jgi:NAD+ kinase
MSFGGSIVYNTLNTLQITPIAPLNNRCYKTLTNSVIIPNDKQICLLPKSDLFLSVDGVNYNIKDIIKIETSIGKKTLKCLRMNDYHFIKIVNNKILES